MGTFVKLNGTTCYGFTCYIGNTCARTTWTLEPLVTGLVEPLGPLMQGLLETPGLTVAGHLVHGQVKEAPVNVEFGNLKSANSQDYAQKPQRNCTLRIRLQEGNLENLV